jgi:hypothetical protein
MHRSRAGQFGPRTRGYAAKRTGTVNNRREIMRPVQCYIARELTADHQRAATLRAHTRPLRPEANWLCGLHLNADVCPSASGVLCRPQAAFGK